jgi:hypothetical protein
MPTAMPITTPSRTPWIIRGVMDVSVFRLGAAASSSLI